MRHGVLSAVAALLAGAGLGRAQPLVTPGPPAALGDPVPALAALNGAATNPATEAFGDCSPGPARSRMWFSGEALLWWFKNSPEQVPLVTAVNVAAVPAQGIAGFIPGSLGAPGTSVVLGGENIDTHVRAGARFTLGAWVDPEQTIGVEGNYFFIAPKAVSRSIASTGNPFFMTVPFFDAIGFTTVSGAPGESAGPILVPGFGAPAAITGVQTAQFTEKLDSRMQGFEVNGLAGVSSWSDVGGLRLHLLGGFRYLNLRESLTFATQTDFGPSGLPGVVLNTLDQFTTRNDFYGGQLGLRGEYAWNQLLVQATAKVALGDVHEQATVSGTTQTNFLTGPGPLTSFPGGVFAQPSNIGRYTQDRFAVLPQVDLKVGYQLTDWALVSVGYSFLYLDRVARPGDQINRNINPSQIPFNILGPRAAVPTGPAEPSFSFHDSGFWAQGVNFGVELRY